MIKAKWMKDGKTVEMVRSRNGYLMGWYEYDPNELCGIWKWAYEPKALAISGREKGMGNFIRDKNGRLYGWWFYWYTDFQGEAWGEGELPQWKN
jgi:hypothetical protein